MKASKVAAVVSELLATDAKPTEAQILAAILAADKKGKDGLGPEEIEQKDKAKDKKAKDGGDPDDPEKTNDEWPDEKAKDEMEDMEAEDDIQPKESATPNKGANKGAEPAKDKKGMDAAIKAAIDARDALHTARRDVETVLGVVGYDSAAEVYKAALDKLGVATDGIHSTAYPALFKLARDKVEAATPRLASDAATVKGMAGVIKGYDRLK